MRAERSVLASLAKRFVKVTVAERDVVIGRVDGWSDELGMLWIAPDVERWDADVEYVVVDVASVAAISVYREPEA